MPLHLYPECVLEVGSKNYHSFINLVSNQKKSLKIYLNVTWASSRSAWLQISHQVLRDNYSSIAEGVWGIVVLLAEAETIAVNSLSPRPWVRGSGEETACLASVKTCPCIGSLEHWEGISLRQISGNFAVLLNSYVLLYHTIMGSDVLISLFSWC